MKCVKCNSEIDNDAQFCPYCGKAVEHGKVCMKCGKPLDDDSDFCPYCGTKQNNVIAEPEQVKEVVQPQEPEIAHKEVMDELQKPEVEEQLQESEVAKEVGKEPASNPTQNDLADTIEPYTESHNTKKWLWIVGAILLLGILSGGVYYLINNKAQNNSIATTDEELNVIETRLHDVLSKLVTNDGEHYLPEFFTEGFNTYYKRACENADKRMYERPRIWCQESEFVPSEFKINSVTSEDGDIISNVTIKGELFSGTYEVLLKNEDGNWLIDRVTQKALEYLDSEDGAMMDDMAAKNSAMEESIIEEKTEFVKEMYKDFFENNNFNTRNAANLKKYLTPDVMERIYLECPYEGSEGEKEYVVDVFYDGSLSYERPDVTITKRQINNIDYDWFEVVGVDKNTGNQIKVQLEVRMGDNGYQVTDFKL